LTPDEILQHNAHRPWPLPLRPWIGIQVWHDLLFAHWPVPAEVLRPLVPPQLPLDTFDGQGWVGVVPFHMSNVRPRGVPPLPLLSAFPELNVRTYVRLEDKPGVYFFSLDAANVPAVWAARALYHLPYFYAHMRALIREDEVDYTSERFLTPAELKAKYRPVRAVELRAAQTLDTWLTERYCLYTVWRNRVYRGDIHHARWPLQDAEAEIERNTMASAAGVKLPDTRPLLHFSKRQDVLIWPLQRIK
jgi:uncharacterized protein YqjF (DUF2071 family)